MMIGTWLARFVGAGVVAASVAACSNSTSGGDDTSPVVDAGHDGGGDAGDGDASVNNRVTGDGGECISNCHEGDTCSAATQCASGICTADKCVDPSCTDGKQDGSETAPDCGGTCAACADGLACIVGGDCESGVCDPNTKLCAAPTDTDGVKNGNETGTDCGSSGTGVNTNAPACPPGQGCTVGTDCANKLCGVNDICLAATCTDGILNGTETTVDCGGSQCNPCPDTDACLVGSDCTSKVCAGGKCAMPTAMDGFQNGNETDKDCGSSGTNDNGVNTHAPACQDGDTCVKGTDCADLVCGTDGTCSLPTCSDGQQNGGETGTDCGNKIITGCGACGTGLGCANATDCESLNCSPGSLCLAPTSTDKIKNGKESDVDCGSSGTGDDTSAPKCPDVNATTGKISLCGAGTDCKSAFCNATTAQCVDGQSCSVPAPTKASIIHDIKTQASTTKGGADAVGVANANGSGLTAGIDTCGVGEATDDANARTLDSCCKSLDVTVSGEGTIRLDKYEVTTGRIRQFVESVSATEIAAGKGAYNIQQWVTDQIAAGTTAGKTMAKLFPLGATLTPGATTDTRTLFPTAMTGTLGLGIQLGATSLDPGYPSSEQGCFMGPGQYAASTYWLDSTDGDSAAGAPPRAFTQDYYDIKSQNCITYWMAAAFCAWDGGTLPTRADYSTVWGSSTYPWGTKDYTYEDNSGDPALKNAGTPAPSYTINNLNDQTNNAGDFYFYPAANGDDVNNPSNPSAGPLSYASIVDTTSSGYDNTPFIASPGRFPLDVTSLAATGIYAKDHWYDIASNMIEMEAATSLTGNQDSFCDTSQGMSATSCPAQYNCQRNGNVCGSVRGGNMPQIIWTGGSWEVHGIGQNDFGEPMQTQYGKTGLRCARPTE